MLFLPKHKIFLYIPQYSYLLIHRIKRKSSPLIRSSFARSFAVCDGRSPSRTHPSSISSIDPKSSVCAAAGIAVSERSLRSYLENHQPFRRALRARAEDDRRLEAIGFAARFTSGRGGSIEDPASVPSFRRRSREPSHAADASVKQDCI